MVDRVKRGTEVEKAEIGDRARICRLVNVRHILDCSWFGWSLFPVGKLQLWKKLKTIKVASNSFVCRTLQKLGQGRQIWNRPIVADIVRIESRLLGNWSDGSGLLKCRKRAAAHRCFEKCCNEWRKFVCKLLNDPRWNWVRFAGFACCTADEAWYYGVIDDFVLIETGDAWRFPRKPGVQPTQSMNARPPASPREGISNEPLRTRRLVFLLTKNRLHMLP